MSRLETRYSWSADGPWSEWTRSGIGDGTEELWKVSHPYRHEAALDPYFSWMQERYVPDDVVAPALPSRWGYQPCTLSAECCT